MNKRDNPTRPTLVSAAEEPSIRRVRLRSRRDRLRHRVYFAVLRYGRVHLVQHLGGASDVEQLRLAARGRTQQRRRRAAEETRTSLQIVFARHHKIGLPISLWGKLGPGENMYDYNEFISEKCPYCIHEIQQLLIRRETLTIPVRDCILSARRNNHYIQFHIAPERYILRCVTWTASIL